MNKPVLFTLIFSVLGYSSCRKKSDDQVPSFPLKKAASFPGTSRMFSKGCSLNTIGYVLWGYGGYSQKDQKPIYPTDFWQYDAAADAWTQKGSFPGEGRIGSESVMFAAGNKLYAGFGTWGFGNTRYDFWEYDPAADRWTNKEWPQKCKYMRGGFGATSKCYLLGNAGGYDDSNYANAKNYIDSNTIYEFDPATNTWQQKATMTVAIPMPKRTTDYRYIPVPGFSTGDRGYFLFGVVDSNYNDKKFWEYNSATDTWTQRSNYPFIVTTDADHSVKASFTINGKGYVFVKNNNSTAVWTYDPATDKWASVTILEPAIYGEIATFAIGSTGFIGLPSLYSGSSYTNLWRFTP